MNGPRIGELFSGYGGLGMGVQSVYGGSIAWHSDIDKGACKILAHRYPDVPNIGDITTVDWSQVEPVDILTGGFPCQDVSAAGKRAGIRPGTRSGLWSHFLYSITQLRPRMVVIENVRGLLSAKAHSDVEPCSWCVGDDPDGALRALGAVLGGLAGVGYDARWHGLRAADVGAAHGRFREFIIATDAQSERRPGSIESRSLMELHRPQPAHAGQTGRTLFPTPRATDGTNGGPNQRGSSGDLMLPSAVALLPTPTVQDGSNTAGASQLDRNSVPLNALVTLLPTPAVNDMGEGKTVDAWDAWTAKMKAAHGNGNGHGASLAIEAQRLLPTPSAIDGQGGPKRIRDDGRTEADHGPALRDLASGDHWGDYAPAIVRWEHALGRPAPAPTMTSKKGNPQLSPVFVEWLMGLPAGWVTDTPGITRNEALKALGNGVVPQQAAAALRVMAEWQVAA